MEATLRLFILALGVLLIAAIYLDGKRKHKTSSHTEKKIVQPSDRYDNFDSAILEIKVDRKKEPQLFEINSQNLGLHDIYPGDIPPLMSVKKENYEPIEPIFIAFCVLAKNGKINGQALIDAFAFCGLEFDASQGIYVRYAEGNKALCPYFKVAQIIEPGLFDLSEIPHQTFTGVTFYLALPGPHAPIIAFDEMLKIARTLSFRLQGDLFDEQRKPLTFYTIQYYRQKIQTFERKYLKQA